MTYKLECFIEKIKAPIICVFDGKEVEYADGMVLRQERFKKRWLVEKVAVRGEKIVLILKEQTNTAESDSETSFF